MQAGYEERIKNMMQSLASVARSKPRVGIILGSGLSSLAIDSGGISIPYEKIREFPKPTVEGHAGIMYISENAIYMAGRFHYYEGHLIDDVVLPVFLLHQLGVETLILTNAAGGVNENYNPGDLVLLKDHINLMGVNPLIGPHSKGFCERFPDMSKIYSKTLRTKAREAYGKEMAEGVYAALSGPSYETPAEIRMLRILGADLVGMSTAPEAIAAAALGMNILGISCVTNMAAGILDQPLNHAEVIETGKKVEKEFKEFLLKFLSNLKNE